MLPDHVIVHTLRNFKPVRVFISCLNWFLYFSLSPSFSRASLYCAFLINGGFSDSTKLRCTEGRSGKRHLPQSSTPTACQLSLYSSCSPAPSSTWLLVLFWFQPSSNNQTNEWKHLYINSITYCSVNSHHPQQTFPTTVPGISSDETDVVRWTGFEYLTSWDGVVSPWPKLLVCPPLNHHNMVVSMGILYISKIFFT